MSEPAWLTEGRKDIGFHEVGENRGIEKFIEQARCGSLGDPWCAIWVNAKLQCAGIRGTRSPAAISFSQDSNFIPCTQKIGAVVVFKRTGGNHVGFYTGMDSQGRLLVLGGNQRDQVCIEPHENNPIGYWWPAQAAQVDATDVPDVHPLIAFGATGAAVLELQKLLGNVDADGEFGPDTEAAVHAFQAAHGLDIDGEVGPLTWPALIADRTTPGKAAIPAHHGLSQQTIDAIMALAAKSELVNHNWRDRGRAPIGYLKGMAVTFGHVYTKFIAGDSSARAMAAPVPASDKDALEWYGIANGLSGIDTLRTVFVLLTGLGMRESSGRCCEGRDTSASNTSADTAEAGLFQQSWNSHTASPEIPKLLAAYSKSGARGFVEIFREGVSGAPTNIFGDGDGAAFQALAKSAPAFAVEAAAVGLRVLRTHWGPINRREAEIVPAADTLFRQVQTIVDIHAAQEAAQESKGTSPVTDPTVTPPPVAPPAPALHPEIKLGSTGAPVTELQKLLNLAQTGFFDFATEAAVRSFQTLHGLDVDGEVGKDTWPILIDPSKAPPPRPIPGKLPALSGAKFDLAKFVEFIDAHKDEAHRTLSTGLAIFNTIHPDKPISLPGVLTAPHVAPAPAATIGSEHVGIVGLLATLLMQSANVVGPGIGANATTTGSLLTLLFGGLASAGTIAKIGPSLKAAVGIIAKVLAIMPK